MAIHRPDPIVRQLAGLGIPRRQAEDLARYGTPITVPAGTVLCTEGERGLQAFLLLAGEAQVHTAERVIPVGPGEVLGELATLDHRRTRNATVVAHTEVEVLVFDARTYRSLASVDALHARLVPARAA